MALVAIVTVGITIYLMTRETPDIRNVFWGANKEHVKAKESAQLEAEKADSLIYKTTLFGVFPAALGYYFNDEKLVTAKYVSMNQYTEFKGCLNEFLGIHDVLSREYGQARATSDKNSREATWETPRSRILLQTFATPEEKFIWMLEYQKLEDIQ